ncbi:phosphate ABC transporter permease PstA [Alterisphingorhabdus coralli]|uniref:Phosphate transport system permease protein PstA n=1 Tax=Alterisphingorhabdus coralli TaxID=3071408 RepID=A0AA97HZ59_9SPHN|nr:phosphate ABC transporter permease PstA [Parasphingorhabdus sp. SCSIO 66989]WOE74239.1 phosphate ABC transporter permease PstA [Parasphingorhabdus sp. SCSIO 66989]
MSETAAMPASTPSGHKVQTDWKSEAMRKRVAKRYAAEKRFKAIGLLAIILSSLFLAFLLFVMVSNGAKGFQRTEIALPIDFATLSGGASPESLEGNGQNAALASLDIRGITNAAIESNYGEDGRKIFARNAWVEVREQLRDDPQLITQNATLWLSATSAFDRINKGDDNADLQPIFERVKDEGNVRTVFNTLFLANSDGVDPALVGIWGALKGSLMTMFITIVLAFPIGVFSAIYLEEYAPQNRWTDLIEVSINNLAAVPSIIFGLLGLVVFLTWIDLPRSSALVGGLTLALMTFPVIVIAARNAVKSVPPSIREAALGIGASKVQVIFHHVLPLAIPGILTGTIIGMARALGETAPLLMIGMRAFTATPPGDFLDPTTVLPVQIYLWSDEVNKGFVEKTSAAIIILLLFLLTMNAVAIWLRNRFETRW